MFKITIDKEGRLLKPENIDKFEFAEQLSQDLCKHLGIGDVPFIGLMSFFADWTEKTSSEETPTVFYTHKMLPLGKFSLDFEGFTELYKMLKGLHE